MPPSSSSGWATMSMSEARVDSLRSICARPSALSGLPSAERPPSMGSSRPLRGRTRSPARLAGSVNFVVDCGGVKGVGLCARRSAGAVAARRVARATGANRCIGFRFAQPGEGSSAAVGEFAVVEVNVAAEEHEDADVGGPPAELSGGEVEEGGPEVEQAVDDESEGDGVGADHPLAVHGDVAVARGEKGCERAEDPERDLDEDAGEVAGARVELDDEAERCGGEDGEDIDAAEDAMELQVAGSEA